MSVIWCKADLEFINAKVSSWDVAAVYECNVITHSMPASQPITGTDHRINYNTLSGWTARKGRCGIVSLNAEVGQLFGYRNIFQAYILR
jgi:hypothetical protein